MIKYSDMVILIGTIAFMLSYVVAIIAQILISWRKETGFTLFNIAIALVAGFAGSIASFFLLYWMFGRA
jgi:drug/metabolite transporter (DMT)-like permease